MPKLEILQVGVRDCAGVAVRNTARDDKARSGPGLATRDIIKDGTQRRVENGEGSTRVWRISKLGGTVFVTGAKE